MSQSEDDQATTVIVEALTACSEGRTDMRNELFAAVYDHLRAIAANHMKSERTDHTLQPTAVVHEAWFRLSSSRNLASATKPEFMAAAATAIRRVLIDSARRHRSQKRGGDALRVELEEESGAGSEGSPLTVDLLALDEALAELAAQFPRPHQVLEMRFFGQMPMSQIAAYLGVSERTAFIDWDFAKGWLLTKLGGGGA